MASLARFVDKFRYSRLGPGDEEQGTTLVKVNFMQLLTSKAVRAIAIISLMLLAIIGLFKLPTANFGRFRPSSSSTTSSSASSSPSPPSSSYDGSRPDLLSGIDWSRFAYVQYVTNTAYLCNSVMLFETLHRLGSKADRLMMYPSSYEVDGSNSEESKLLRKARDQYGVKLMPIEIQRRASGDATWAESYTKLLAFNQTQYARVLSLDSDSTVLQTMDELFLAPSAPVAMPRAYWLNFDERTLSSQVVLIEPSEFEFNRVMKAMNEAKSNDYDMEIVNYLYKDSALILPHRPYDLLTGEFRSDNHSAYLGNSEEAWDPDKILKEAKFLHFSDWPVPKPWLTASPAVIQEKQPKCEKNPTTGEEDNCRNRDLWLGFYSDFKKRRQVSDPPHFTADRQTDGY
ncbi:Golgi Precursor [Rasamsonia emersonii CBS 393.64]|uniref:Golgi n=1 Tax=Rasamsonia emersonii (strain ATCC 16479 / CBS 393.64 / IMI 116815) TaxID=1408163 RepID=A0A0F4YNV0_RASE3|nr:Golgi Precursor [Rasamsonia emersonii CBS 393.64]KKA19942.1 Golgi Precursor [Rasamsonia emersonii CBS 393.64]